MAQNDVFYWKTNSFVSFSLLRKSRKNDGREPSKSHVFSTKSPPEAPSVRFILPFWPHRKIFVFSLISHRAPMPIGIDFMWKVGPAGVPKKHPNFKKCEKLGRPDCPKRRSKSIIEKNLDFSWIWDRFGMALGHHFDDTGLRFDTFFGCFSMLVPLMSEEKRNDFSIIRYGFCLQFCRYLVRFLHVWGVLIAFSFSLIL